MAAETITTNGAAVAAYRPQSVSLTSLPPTEELTQAWKLADALVKTGFLPKAVDTPAKAVAIYLKGRELGLPFMQAQGSIHVIEGKPSVSAELLCALCFQRVPGFGMKIIQADAQACVIEFRRTGSEPFRYSYSIEDATRAGLAGKGPWKSHPASMLAARCKGQGLRLYCPDATMGTYATEELVDDPARMATSDAPAGPAPAVQPRPAAAAVRKQQQVEAVAAASVAEVLGDETGDGRDAVEVGTDAAPVVFADGHSPAMSAEDRAQVLADGSLDGVITALAAMRAATKGERHFYTSTVVEGETAPRFAIVDAELLLSFRKEPVNTWLEQIKRNAGAWVLFCRALIKVADQLGVEVVR